MKFISLFSGIEAASCAWEPLGWHPVAFAEVDPFCCDLLAARWPGVPNLGDVTKVEWSKWSGKADVVVGGTPCQAFSVAGLRKSLSDERGNLTLEFVKAVELIQPRYVVWENVAGVLGTRDNAFGCFLGALVGADTALVPPGRRWTNAGVVDGPKRSAAWRLLDAQYFGLAQRRKRVFVVASSGDGAHPGEILFECEGVQRHSPPSRETREGIAPTISARTKGGGGLGTDFDCDGGLIASTLKANNGGGGFGSDPSETFIPVTNPLRADGFDASEDGTGRGTPLIVSTMLGEGDAHSGYRDEHGLVVTPILEAGTPLVPCKPGFIHPRQLRNSDCHSSNQVGIKPDADISDALTSEGPGAVCVPILEAAAQGGKQHAVAFQEAQTGVREYDTAGSLRANGPGHDPVGTRVRSGMAVRRLTVLECEWLMGFPSRHTAIIRKGKPAADGPRYKALGNSFAVPVMRWIGERIEKVEGKPI